MIKTKRERAWGRGRGRRRRRRSRAPARYTKFELREATTFFYKRTYSKKTIISTIDGILLPWIKTSINNIIYQNDNGRGANVFVLKNPNQFVLKTVGLAIP